MGDTIRATVVAKGHANMDSLPLRFGVHFAVDTEIELFDCKDLGPDDQFKDRHHFQAQLKTEPSAAIQLGHFVLGDQYETGRWTLVTVWREDDQRTEFYLSETLKRLREDGMLNPAMLKQMHPHYLKGQINSSAALIRYLAKASGAADIASLQLSEKNAHETARQALAERDRLRQENDLVRTKEANARAIAEEAISVVESLETKSLDQEEKNRRLQDEVVQMRKALAAIQTAEKLRGEPSVSREHVVSPAKAITRPWPSNKPNSTYVNIGIEAEVVDVQPRGSNIELTYIDKDGRNRTVTDFGYEGFVHEIFDYLKSCKDVGRRAVFILTYKPDMKMRLAADTMMWRSYRALWQNA